MGGLVCRSIRKMSTQILILLMVDCILPKSHVGLTLATRNGRDGGMQCYACGSKEMPVEGTKAKCSDGLGDKIKCPDKMNDGCGEYFDKENGEVQARFCIKFQGQTDSCRTDGCDYIDLNEKGRKWTCICTKTDLCNNYNSTTELPPDWHEPAADDNQT